MLEDLFDAICFISHVRTCPLSSFHSGLVGPLDAGPLCGPRRRRVECRGHRRARRTRCKLTGGGQARSLGRLSVLDGAVRATWVGFGQARGHGLQLAPDHGGDLRRALRVAGGDVCVM